MQLRPPKMHFPAVPAQDRFYFLNEGELQMNQGNSSNIAMKQLLLISFLLHKVLSQQRQQSRFVSTSIRAAIGSFVCLKFSTLALLKASIVKTSFSLSLKIQLFGAVKTIMSNISRGRRPSHSLRILWSVQPQHIVLSSPSELEQHVIFVNSYS